MYDLQRLEFARQDLARMRALASELARALSAEAVGQYEVGHLAEARRRHDTREALHEARREGLI